MYNIDPSILMGQLWLVINGLKKMSQIPDVPAHKNTFFPLVLHVANEVLRVFADHVGASPTRLYILSLLFRHNEMTQAELKRLLGLDPAAVSRHLHSLKDDGIVSRRINPDRHRQGLVSLTGAGCRYLTDLASAKDRLEAQLFDDVGITPQEHTTSIKCCSRLTGAW
jgi:DNA-binding MarR family transcriptional regulator